MKRLVIGVLAHVDAGKTTLVEGMLFQAGQLKQLGRVDHQTAFLDTNPLEQERGITIFSKQALLSLQTAEITLLDTPGHVDFSSEMERALQALDYAVLVISGSDGVQSHTQTLWQLLARAQIPTFLFLNKMDLPAANREALLRQLSTRLQGGFVDFTAADFLEDAALLDEGLFQRYLDTGSLTDDELASLIRHRRLFPCYFGAALHMEGIAALLSGLEQYTRSPIYPPQFGAKVWAITRDAQGQRLTHMKITGGSLRVKAPLTNRQKDTPPEQVWQEKADQLRLYSGRNYHTAEMVFPGGICAVTGLNHTYPGQGLGIEPPSPHPVLRPVLSYQVLLAQGVSVHTALQQLRQLEQEDPQLHILWKDEKIHLQLMGEIQLEILKRLASDRFGLALAFAPGSIIYKETILAPVEGVGHFEPLRHYAEVHLLLEPGERGSGLVFDTACSEAQLDRGFQRLILSHLAQQEHVGVLTGAPVTDLRVTLVAGRAHPKHTQGGDFRQAAYRALRQGLKCAESLLLEPWYSLRLELPTPQIGRAMSDLQRKCGVLQPPQTVGEYSILTGSAPAVLMEGYAAELAAYTQGRGRLVCSVLGYLPCHNQSQAVAAAQYDSDRDTEHPADSVFCDQGAGYTVKWDRVRQFAHAESPLRLNKKIETVDPRAAAPRSPAPVTDRELQAIFERTYGPVRRRDFLAPPRRHDLLPETQLIHSPEPQQEYLLVDGYNIIFAWDDLRRIARDNLDAARQQLMDLMCNYQGYKKCQVILVFDAYRVARNAGETLRYHNIHVVYTKEAETADAYIEKTTYQLGKKHKVRVATSDGYEQLIILGHGALRLSAKGLYDEMAQVRHGISDAVHRHNQKAPATRLKDVLRPPAP